MSQPTAGALWIEALLSGHTARLRACWVWPIARAWQLLLELTHDYKVRQSAHSPTSHGHCLAMVSVTQ